MARPFYVDERGRLVRAPGHDEGATRVKTATTRQVREIRRGAGYARELRSLAVHRRERIQQSQRVGVSGGFVELSRRGPLHQCAGVHDDDLVRQLSQEGQVVRNEYHGEAETRT